MEKYTINNFLNQFPDDGVCLEWLKNKRYPNGIYCEKCKKVTKHYRVKKRTCYACNFCGSHVYPMASTILEKSTTSLRQWFYAIFLMANTRCGISAKQLQRELGVTYKTAWRMFKQIRSMMNEDIMSLLNEIEIDETYFGGRFKGKRGRGSENKSVVFGMAERNGKVIAQIVPNAKSKTILPIIKSKVTPDSTIYTDELPSYDRILKLGYKHERINHGAKLYVNGNASTNTIEGFWSQIKRGIDGVHHSLSPKYLQDYINSYSFRWNRRNDTKPMFFQILSRLVSSSLKVQ